MMTATYSTVEPLELPRLAIRAVEERWIDFAVASSPSDCQVLETRGWKPDRIFLADHIPLALISAIAACSTLQKLALVNAGLSNETARPLRHLKSLTHLDIRGNQVNAEGLSLLLPGLPLIFLDLSQNPIETHGARILAQLKDSIRVLHLASTRLSPAAAGALSALCGLEKLDLSFNSLDDCFIERLASLRSLKSLTLNYCKITDKGGAAIQELRDLEDVCLQGNSIGTLTSKSLSSLPRLSELILTNAPVTDECLGYLGRATTLSALHLSSDKLTDSGAHHLKSLVGLRTLSLHGKQIGTAGCEFLGNLRSLRKLNLSVRDLDQAGDIAMVDMHQLKSVSIAANVSESLLSHLCDHEHLEHFALRAPNLDPAWLQRLNSLPNLTSINFSGSKIGDRGASAISRFKTIKFLSAPDSSIEKYGVQHISELSHLVRLDLSRNNIGDTGAKCLSRLTELEHLELRDCNIGSDGAQSLASLVNLTSLILERNHIGPQGPGGFSNLPRLEHLDLLGNGIGDDGAVSLCAGFLPSLKSLNLPNNHIGPAGARAIAKLGNLETLSLSNNQIGDDGAHAISTLPSLKRLHLAGSGLGAAGARSLGKITSLIHLDLQVNSIGPDGMRAIVSLTELRHLNIHANEIGELGVEFLIRLSNLRTLHASYNAFGSAAVQLQQLTSLTGLSLQKNGVDDVAMRSITLLPLLEDLDVSSNRISDSGLSNIAYAKNLRSLLLPYNQLRNLDHGLAQVPYLTHLDLKGNPLSPSLAHAYSRGVEALLLHLYGGTEAHRNNAMPSSRSDYNIEPAPIDSGGQARVSKAVHKVSHRHVAFKELLDPADEDARARLRREIDAAQLIQDNIMPVLDWSVDECWLTMPIAHYTLEEYAGVGPRVSDADITEIVDSILNALEIAHSAGWVHRDIKPSNVLYVEHESHGRWVLSDWGLVRRPRGQTSIPHRTKVGTFLGTEGFAAPESTSDAHSVGPQCDFYSIGQVVGWLVTQKDPRPNIPLLPGGPWDHFVRNLTQERPQDRPGTVDDVRGVLRVVTSGIADPSAALSDQALLNAASEGSLTHLDTLVQRAIQNRNDSHYYFDLLPDLETRHIIHIAENRPSDLRELIVTLERHLDSDWGSRGFNSLNKPILFALRAAQIASKLGNKPLFEAGAQCALKWETKYDRFEAHGKILRWLATLTGDSASFVAVCLASDQQMRRRFADIATVPDIPYIIRRQIPNDRTTTPS